ncbi:hypothetical protein [Erythrobacter aurantius]|uniref:hypothetical protein n=1 Tax=Erythrobacter aurantius TaxID=2909249 RepID=UPI00207989A6|nr:hypothetical protein [Erythrobacter aurantius]
MSLSEIERSVGAAYQRCASERSGQPVFGLEHGLEPDEIARAKVELGRRLRSHSADLAISPFPLCLVACSSEVGYHYRGTGTDFWPKFEAEIGAELDESARKAHTKAFEFAHKGLGIKAPADTPWTRNFRHIAWPVTNAIASREVHRPLAMALRRTMAFAFADSSVDELVARLRIEARSQQNTRLIEWLEVTDVASALVARLLEIPPPEGAVDTVSLDRIIADLEADPVARQAVASASARRSAARPRRERPKFRFSAHLASDDAPSFSLRVPELDLRSLALLEEELGRSGGAVPLAPPGMELRLSDLAPGRDLLMSPQMLHAVMSGEVSGFVDEERSSAVLTEQLSDLMPTASDPLFLVEETRGGSFVDWPIDRKIPRSRRIIVATSRKLPESDSLVLLSGVGDLKLFEVNAAIDDGRSFLASANLFMDQHPVFEFVGGIQIGEGVRGPVFARGMPVALRRCGPDSDGEWSIRSGEAGTVSLSEAEIAVVLDGTKERDVLEVRTGAARATSEIQFYEPGHASSPLAIRMEPSSPSVEDIERGRLSLVVDCPLDLPSVTLQVSIHSGGRVIASSSGALSMIPATYAETSRVTAELSRKLADASPARSSRLYLEVSLEGIWKHRQPLGWDPVPVDWHRNGNSWRAVSETGELELSRSMIEAPLLRERYDETTETQDVFTVFVPDKQGETIFEGAIADGPGKLDLGTIEPGLPTEVLRTLAGSSEAAGFRETLEGYLLWSCARPTHSVASLVARRVAGAIEAKIVQQLCGTEWVKAETRSQISGGSLHDVLASEALESGLIAEEEIPPIPEARRQTFLKILSSKIEAAWTIMPLDPEQIDFELFADRMDVAAADAYEEFASHVDGPDVEKFENADPYSEPPLWRNAHRMAVGRISGRLMSQLILPTERGKQLQEWDYRQSSAKLISLLAELHADLSPRGQRKWIDASILQDGFHLWIEPSELLKTDDWLSSISRFLQDRQTARAVRYAALRYRASRSLVQIND